MSSRTVNFLTGYGMVIRLYVWFRSKNKDWKVITLHSFNYSYSIQSYRQNPMTSQVFRWQYTGHLPYGSPIHCAYWIQKIIDIINLSIYYTSQMIWQWHDRYQLSDLYFERAYIENGQYAFIYLFIYLPGQIYVYLFIYLFIYLPGYIYVWVHLP